MTPQVTDADRLLAREHPQPHAYLGAHQDGDGSVVVRAFRPAAAAVSVVPEGGELDLHLVGEGRHEQMWERLGAHVREVDGVRGTAFAVWAPSARTVSVVGDFNFWDGRMHPMRSLGSSGIWEVFLPGVESGARYKYEIIAPDGELRLKADPVAFEAEVPPKTASVVFDSHHTWTDEDWLSRRRGTDPLVGPMSIYEVHLGS